MTVTRAAEQEWLVLTAAATVGREMDRLRKSIGDSFVTVSDVSAGLAMLSVMGPRSRELLQGLTDADLSHEGFGFATSRMIDLGATFVRATRLTYVGELGWELLVPADQAVHVYRTLAEAGAARRAEACRVPRPQLAAHGEGVPQLGARHRLGGYPAGSRARRSPWRGTSRVGSSAGTCCIVSARRRPTALLVQLRFDDPEVLAYHDEPIYRDGVKVGKVASASYGWTLGASVVLGYVGARTPSSTGSGSRAAATRSRWRMSGTA